MPKTHAQNQKAFEQRRIQKGWKRRGVWVPPDCSEYFDRMVRRLQSNKDYKEAVEELQS